MLGLSDRQLPTGFLVLNCLELEAVSWHAVVFGRVIEGMAVVKKMEACGSSSGSVNQRVSIAECGEVSTRSHCSICGHVWKAVLALTCPCPVLAPNFCQIATSMPLQLQCTQYAMHTSASAAAGVYSLYALFSIRTGPTTLLPTPPLHAHLPAAAACLYLLFLDHPRPLPS